MPGMIEVAQATVTIIPTMEGAQAEITKGLTGAAAAGGDAAGKAAGKGLTSSMSSTMSKAGSALTKGVTVPIAAIGAASIAAFNDVDAGLDTIVSKTGASGEALDDMETIMKDIATSIPTDFETAGAAIGEVNTRFGLTGKSLEDLSRQFIQFAKINDTDVSTSVDNVSKVLAAFGLGAEDAGTMLDALNVVGQKTGVDIGTLSGQLSQNAVQFQQMGLTVEEAASFLGQCDMAGIETSTMLMGLKTAMKNATSDGKSLDDVLGSFSQTMTSNASESDKLAAAYEAFGTRAGSAIFNAVNNGQIDLANFTASLGNFEGSVNNTFDSMTDPTEEFTQVINELKVLGAEIAEAVMPTIKSVVESAVPVIKDMVEGWNSLSPEMQQFIIKGALVAAAIGPIMSAGGGLIKTLGSMKTGFSGLTSTMSAASAKFGGFTGVMGTNVSTLGSTMSGGLGMAGAAVGTFMAAFSITDWLLELTGAKEKLEQFGSDIYDFFHKGEMESTELTNSAMAAFEAYALRGEGTFESVMQQLTDAQKAASETNTAVTRQDAETLQKYIDMMESGVAEARSKEAQARQQSNASMVADSQMTAETLQATMDAAQSYISTGAGDLETIMTDLQTAYDYYASKTDSTSKTTATSIAQMMESLTTASGASIEATDEMSSETIADLATISQAMNSLGITDIGAFSSAVSKGMQSMQKDVETATKAMVTSIDTNMDTAVRKTQNSIKAIETAFKNADLSFNQHIALPHFTMKGTFNAKSGTVPDVSVNWYKRAAEQGALFANPTIIGVGDAAQPEMLIGERTLYENIAKAMKGAGMIINITNNIDGAENPEEFASRVVRQIKMEMRMA